MLWGRFERGVLNQNAGASTKIPYQPSMICHIYYKILHQFSLLSHTVGNLQIGMALIAFLISPWVPSVQSPQQQSRTLARIDHDDNDKASWFLTLKETTVHTKAPGILGCLDDTISALWCGRKKNGGMGLARDCIRYEELSWIHKRDMWIKIWEFQNHKTTAKI